MHCALIHTHVLVHGLLSFSSNKLHVAGCKLGRHCCPRDYNLGQRPVSRTSYSAPVIPLPRHRSRFALRCKVEPEKEELRPDAQSTFQDPLKSWPVIGATLLGLGFVVGPLLDGIHSNVQLQLYDNGAFEIGPLHTNVVVPPLLAVFYGVAGLLQLALDKWFARQGQLPKASLKRLLLSLVFLILILEVSAELYKAGVAYNVEAYMLFALAEVNWVLFDGTWWGFGLAAVIGVVCPLSEVPLMKIFNVWHYPKANVEVFGEGLVTWVLACYFSYMPFLANLARWLSVQINLQTVEKSSE